MDPEPNNQTSSQPVEGVEDNHGPEQLVSTKNNDIRPTQIQHAERRNTFQQFIMN